MHIITPVLINYLPESPRWLLATNKKVKMDEAKGILEDAALKNGTLNEDTRAMLDVLATPMSDSELQKARSEQLGFLDLFRHSVLRRRALVMYFNWFANSFILYGLSLNWQSLTGSLFTNFIIGA